MNIWLGLMASSAAPINTFSTELPSQNIQVRLLSQGMVHATAFFKRQGAVTKSLFVDLGFIDKYEVTWEYLLNNAIAENIHTFRLNRASTEKQFPFVLRWPTSWQQQSSLSVPSTLSASTESTPATTTTANTNIDTYNNTVTEYVCLREVSLCCSRLRADSEYDLIELIKLATSPTLDLKRLCLDPPEAHSLANQNGGRISWSGLFINYTLWNLEEPVIKDSNFGGIHIEGFLFFMANMKKLEDNEKTKRREQDNRRRQLEFRLITLEDGELEEEDVDYDIVRMRLKVFRFKDHFLTPEAESYMMED